jgi:hypothetical protein
MHCLSSPSRILTPIALTDVHHYATSTTKLVASIFVLSKGRKNASSPFQVLSLSAAQKGIHPGIVQLTPNLYSRKKK